MTRIYHTQPTMFVSQFPTYDEGVVQPDANLVEQLHNLLDMIEADEHALAIDHTVQQLLRFHQPAYQAPGTATLLGTNAIGAPGTERGNRRQQAMDELSIIERPN